MAITDYYGTETDKELGEGVLGEYPDTQADTKANTTGGYLDFGVGVQLTSANENAVEVYDGTGTFYGITLAQKFGDTDYDAVGYEDNMPVAVLRKGTVWVKVLEEVTAGEMVVADDTTGLFRPASTAETLIHAINGQFKTSAGADELALVEIILPNK